MVNSILAVINYLLEMVAKPLTFLLLCGDRIPSGSLRQSFIVVFITTIQLCVSVVVARAIIFFHLLTSGDVEQNPGPVQIEFDCKYSPMHYRYINFSF